MQRTMGQGTTPKPKTPVRKKKLGLFQQFLLGGLFASLVGNAVLLYVNHETNRRADRDSQRVDYLMKKKEEWFNNLDDQVRSIDRKLSEVTLRLQTDGMEANTTLDEVRNALAVRNVHADSAELINLQQEKQLLQKQLNDLASALH